MGYREVRIYGGDFPTHEQVVTGDPSAPAFPREVWLEQVAQGEVAVRCKDFKAGLPRGFDGQPVRSSEVCRIFDNADEARGHAREIVEKHPATACLLYDCTGLEMDRITNTKAVSRFAAYLYVSALLWISLYSLMGMAALWILYRLALIAISLWRPVAAPLHPLSWWGWLLFALAGLLASVVMWLGRARWNAAKKIKKVHSSFTPDEMKTFGQINTLHRTADPAEREKLLNLMREFQRRVTAALKK